MYSVARTTCLRLSAPVIARSSTLVFPPLPGQESLLRWGGKKYEELPIAHIKATYNNTHIQVTDHLGQYMVRTSCGTEGFKNVKKGTPVAAQTAGISAAAKALVKGVSFVRVVVKGLGPGRMKALVKGVSFVRVVVKGLGPGRMGSSSSSRSSTVTAG
ncbi:UNVERIFIED_CONTAM: hypothetical protein FKN15_057146 [Acipenser sinensis]